MTKWFYTGDMNIECGGMFVFDDGPDLSPDYLRIVSVTPASDGGGMDNRFLIERGNVYMPNDDLKRMRSTADTCGYKLDDNKNLIDGLDSVHEFQSPTWRLLMLDAWNAYHGIDSPDSWVVQVGTEKPDPNRRAEFLDNQEPDYILRRNVNLKRWIEREFCN